MSWGGLKPQKLVCSWLWRLQAQNQGVSRAALSRRALGEEEAFLPVPASGAPGVPRFWPHPSSLCLVFHVASPSPLPSVLFVSYKDTCHCLEGPQATRTIPL